MLNAFILYRIDHGTPCPTTFLQFQREVISSLLFDPTEGVQNQPTSENLMRLTERHFISHIPPTEKKGIHCEGAGFVLLRESARRAGFTVHSAPARQHCA